MSIASQVRDCVEGADEEVTAFEVSLRTGLPRRTVAYWLQRLTQEKLILYAGERRLKDRTGRATVAEKLYISREKFITAERLMRPWVKAAKGWIEKGYYLKGKWV